MSLGAVAGRLWGRGRGTIHRFLADNVYPSLGFPVVVSPIRERANVGRITVSRPKDFELGLPTARRDIDFRRNVPYCADYNRGKLYFTRMSPEHDRSSPFLYLAQREHADRVAVVPIDALARFHDPDFVARSHPLLIFSTGRCGSTLLARMLLESGLYAYSEPDIFNQWPRSAVRPTAWPA